MHAGGEWARLGDTKLRQARDMNCVPVTREYEMADQTASVLEPIFVIINFLSNYSILVAAFFHVLIVF